MADHWEAAYNNEGAAAVAALYLEDGVRMPPDMPIAKGRAAIPAQVQGGMDNGLAKVEVEVVESMVSGETGVSRGTFKGLDADGNTMTEGKWMSVSKWVDGKWQVDADIWKMDAPAPMPEYGEPDIGAVGNLQGPASVPALAPLLLLPGPRRPW